MPDYVETMAWNGETPWHGLGIEVEADISPDDMRVKAGVDWSVRKVPTFGEINGKMTASNTSMLVREGGSLTETEWLDDVSNDWNPVQNEEAFDFFKEFADAGEMQMCTAGSLRGGRIVWALAKINDGFTLFGGDEVEDYLLFTNPHQYGKSVDIRFTPIRVVCQNTLNMALNGKAEFQIALSHRTAFNADAAKKAIGLAKIKNTNFKEVAEFLGSKRYTNDNVKEYFSKVFPSQKRPNESGIIAPSRQTNMAMAALEMQPGREFAEGSWWQAFNAVTFLTDHQLGHNNDSRLVSAWYGANRDRKLKAMAMAVDYAEAA